VTNLIVLYVKMKCSYWLDVLGAQLAEQQLFFEKKIAQETIRALELSLQQHQQQGHVPAPSNRAPAVVASSSSSSASSPSYSKLDEYFEDIATKKMELSKLEYSYNELLNKIRDVERETRIQKKVNIS
jgi:hypothetical protein